MDTLEKYWKETFALIIGGGFFTFLGGLLNQLANKNKIKSEETKNNSEAEKAEAEADLARARFMAETQEALAKMGQELQAMRDRYDQMYEAREKERDARERERNEARDDKQRILDQVGSLSALNVELKDQVHRRDQSAFERELVLQSRISELETKVAEQVGKVKAIEIKTGNLEDKMPKHAQ